MRLFAVLFFSLVPLGAQTADEKEVVAAVQKLFDGMAAHDAAMIRSAMMPDARIHSVRDQAEAAGRSAEELIQQVVALKSELLERFTARPRVMLRGRMAQVWGEYEFLREGKFSHCGVDSVSLFKTNEGWRIAAIAYTVETTGCKGQ